MIGCHMWHGNMARQGCSINDMTALAVALEGLREVAPGRALGSFAGHLASSVEGQPQTEDALALLTFAAAGATNAGTQDSLMFVYSVTLRRLGRCTEAAPIFESLVRRQRAPRVATGAQRQLVLCALDEGRRALRNGQLVDAETWFRRAVAGAGDHGRPARVYFRRHSQPLPSPPSYPHR